MKKYKFLAVLFSILAVISVPAFMFVVIGAFSSNILLGIMSMFLFSLSGYIYNKALKFANKSESKLLVFFTKYIVIGLFLFAILGSILGISYIIELIN